MKTHEQDFRAYLAGHDVLLAEEGSRRLVMDYESLTNLEKLVSALAAQVERLGEVVIEVGTDPPLHRLASREIKEDVACLIRRLGHLRHEVSAAHAEGYSRAQTSRDRQEIEALAVAVPLMEAALKKARDDNAQNPGGKPLSTKYGIDPLVTTHVEKPAVNGAVVRRKGGG